MVIRFSFLEWALVDCLVSSWLLDLVVWFGALGFDCWNLVNRCVTWWSLVCGVFAMFNVILFGCLWCLFFMFVSFITDLIVLLVLELWVVGFFCWLFCVVIVFATCGFCVGYCFVFVLLFGLNESFNSNGSFDLYRYY